jgi:hypothetical protein
VEVSISQGSGGHYSIRDVTLLYEPVYKRLPFAIDLYNALSEAIYLLMTPAEAVIGDGLMDLLAGSPPSTQPSGIFSLIVGRLLFAEGHGSTEVRCECGHKRAGGISRDELRPACTCTAPVIMAKKAVPRYFWSISRKSPPQDPIKLLAQSDSAVWSELDRLVAGFVERVTGHTLMHFALS